MTSLHYILIGLGIFLVAAMVLYNYLQERRFRKQADRVFNMRREDLPLGVSFGEVSLSDPSQDARIEPTFRLVDETEAPPAAGGAEVEQAEAPATRGEATWLGGGEPAADLPGPHDPEPEALEPEASAKAAVRHEGAPAFEPESPLDAEIEYVTRLRFTRPSPIDYTPLLESLSRISKPIRLAGRSEDGHWEPVRAHAARAYDTVELAILLADRVGPVSEVQLDSFCNRLYEFVAQYGGAASCPDKPAALDRAQALDGFCAEVDMLIGLNVVTPEPAGFAGEDIHRLVAEAGLLQGTDGRYGLHDQAGRLLFSLANNDGEAGFPVGGEGLRTRSLSLLLDVPRVPQGLQVFDRMTEFGQYLARALGGRLVDDGGRPVSRDSLERDRRRLTELYGRMESRGITAGGERALRLFA